MASSITALQQRKKSSFAGTKMEQEKKKTIKIKEEEVLLLASRVRHRWHKTERAKVMREKRIPWTTNHGSTEGRHQRVAGPMGGVGRTNRVASYRIGGLAAQALPQSSAEERWGPMDGVAPAFHSARTSASVERHSVRFRLMAK